MTLDLIIQQSLNEDAPHGDITVDSLFDQSTSQNATLIAKSNGIFFGKAIIQAFLNYADPDHQVIFYVDDGDFVTASTKLCNFKSTFSKILLIERSMLNLIQHLSGVATLTNQFVKKLNAPHIAICDTRKTMVGLRNLEKNAVKAGGGTNHRFGLSDMILIKENHLKLFENLYALSSLDSVIQRAKRTNPQLKAEIEIETLDQLKTLPLASFDYVMFDNFSITSIPEASAFCRSLYPHLKIEVSGNVSLDTIENYRCLDIDRISIGALTHSAPAFDISLLLL